MLLSVSRGELHIGISPVIHPIAMQPAARSIEKDFNSNLRNMMKRVTQSVLSKPFLYPVHYLSETEENKANDELGCSKY